MASVSARIGKSAFENDFRLYINKHGRSDGVVLNLTQVVFDSEAPLPISIDYNNAQQLMSDLWSFGIRPDINVLNERGEYVEI